MLNRRDFLKSMAVASAGLAVAPGQILGNEIPQNQKKPTKPLSESETGANRSSRSSKKPA